MTGTLPLLVPVLGIGLLLALLLGLRPSTADRRGSETLWCGAGLLMIVLLGLLLADADDLLSPSERLFHLDFGPWFSWSELGSDDVNWVFQITPLAAWWGIAVSGLLCLTGWTAHRAGESLPFGGLGAVLWLATCGIVFAEDLLTAFFLLTAQGMLAGLWLAGQARTAESVTRLQRWLMTTFISDSLGLLGVLLAGLACRTFDFYLLADAEFLHDCWQERPAVCGLAGSCLFLGLLAKCTLFPFCSGSQHVQEFSGLAGSLIHVTCIWPAAMWFFLRIHPLLRTAPETGAVVQGLALVGAAIGAFLAAGQTDLRRTVILLTTSQLGLMMSVMVLSDVFTPVGFALGIGPLLVAAVTVLRSCSLSIPSSGWQRMAVSVALWTLAGSGPSPAFWLTSHSVQRFAEIETAARNETQIAHGETSTHFTPAPAVTPQPLPVTTWTAGWCMWSFFATFAGWRGWRQRDSRGKMANGNGIIEGVLLTALIAGAAGALWHSSPPWSSLLTNDDWPLRAALTAAGTGGILSVWVCRDAALTESRWQQLGSWTQLASREFYLTDLWRIGGEFPIRVIAHLVQICDWSLMNPAGRWLLTWAARCVVAAGNELRTESVSFYTGAVLLTVATCLITWLTLVAGG